MKNSNFVRSDLHIHLDEAQGKEQEAIKDILQRAQKLEVKALSFVLFNRIDHFEENSQLHKMHKTGEIEKYFSGKIVSGVEMICRMNGTEISDSGFNFKKYISHVILYDYDPTILSKTDFFAGGQAKKSRLDLLELLEKTKALGLTVPSIDYFNPEDKHFTTPLYNYIYEHRDSNPINAQFVKDYPNKSSMQRYAVEDPEGILFFQRRSYPTYSEVVEMAKVSGAKIVLAHPAKHNDLFDTFEYIRAMLDIVPGSFWGLEGQYMLNSKEETKMICAFAKVRGLKVTGGSDFKYYVSEKNPEGKMYFIENDKKMFYVPRPSFLIKESIDGEPDPHIKIEKSVLDELKDFREYYK
ncbi:MAG: PHP domain-containing protein [Christensenellales bacterium]|jgi:hypothetical protein